MEFKDFLMKPEEISENAALKLELLTKINSLISNAELGTLRKVVKILESDTQN